MPVQNSIALGLQHCLYLDTNSCVWSCGKNQFGQLGQSNQVNKLAPTKIKTLPEIESVYCGTNQSFLLDVDGKVWSCGCNDNGQLGHGTFTSLNQPVEIKNIPSIQDVLPCGVYTILLDRFGGVWMCKNAQTKLPFPVGGTYLPPIQMVSGSAQHILLLDKNGDVWSCGNNSGGQLGTGDGKPKTEPVKIETLSKIRHISAGMHHSIFINIQGEVYTCGRNDFGQLGVGDYNARLEPVKLQHDYLPLIQTSFTSSTFTFFLDYDGGVWCCGRNEFGQLGLGDYRTRNIPTKLNIDFVQDIDLSPSHALLLDIDGVVWSVGNNDYGQLGIGDFNKRNIPTAIQNLPQIQRIYCSDNYFSVLLDTQGGIWSFGRNSEGQLGLSDRKGRFHPTLITSLPVIRSPYSGISIKNARFESHHCN